MCGIAGWLSFRRNLEEQRPVLVRMTDTMALRGPDAEGLWINGPVGLGHRRLAIIDLDGGRQPMVTSNKQASGDIVLIYTGEVYNFGELRDELKELGHRFETLSDTEVVLNAYREWGLSFAERLNGMYAFAVWDEAERQLALVRDRMGVKPLYYYETEDGLIFGSEPKAILANPLVERRVNADGFREILEMVKTPGRAIFAGMREVLPGHLVIANPGGIVSKPYWRLEATAHEDDLPTTIARTRELLEDIVRRQMVADVPLCSLLSGGLDSSIITSLAAREKAGGGNGSLHTFSLDFADHGEDFAQNNFNVSPDTPFVRALIDRINCDHHEIILASDSMAEPDLRRKVVQAIDAPPSFWGDMWPSLYRLFEEVRARSTVALSGEAADEIFGGYRWFHDPVAIEERTFGWLASPTRSYFDGTGLLSKDLLTRLDLDAFRSDSYADAVADTPVLPGESALDRRMREETYVHLSRCIPIMLDRKDRMSMAVGLEVRVPFCDHRLVEYAFNVPWDMKSFDGREKSLLRAAARDLLPSAILDRVKNPYPATQDPAYEQKLRDTLSGVWEDRNAPVWSLLEKSRIEETLGRNLEGVSPRQNRIGIELALGLNQWLSEYEVTIDI